MPEFKVEQVGPYTLTHEKRERHRIVTRTGDGVLVGFIVKAVHYRAWHAYPEGAKGRGNRNGSAGVLGLGMPNTRLKACEALETVNAAIADGAIIPDCHSQGGWLKRRTRA